MKLYPNQMVEYINRHNPIWNDLIITLKNHGVHNYNIFFDNEDNTLFAYVEVESEIQWQAISKTEICQKWWTYMKDIMETNSDNSPISKNLISVFYLK